MDQEWFVFETAGTLVVGWEGGPLHHTTMVEPGERRGDDSSRPATGKRSDMDDSESSDDDLPTVTSKGKTKTEALDLAGYERPKTVTTGIEIAAALATGLFSICTYVTSSVAQLVEQQTFK